MRKVLCALLEFRLCVFGDTESLKREEKRIVRSLRSRRSPPSDPDRACARPPAPAGFE